MGLLFAAAACCRILLLSPASAIAAAAATNGNRASVLEPWFICINHPVRGAGAAARGAASVCVRRQVDVRRRCFYRLCCCQRSLKTRGGDKIIRRRRPPQTLRSSCCFYCILYLSKHIYYQKEAHRFSTFSSANLGIGGCMGMSEETRSK